MSDYYINIILIDLYILGLSRFSNLMDKYRDVAHIIIGNEKISTSAHKAYIICLKSLTVVDSSRINATQGRVLRQSCKYWKTTRDALNLF